MTHRTARRSTALVTALGLCAVTAVATGAASVEAAPVSHGADTTATVFLPNPVQQLGDQTLTDRKDADYAALGPAYRRVTLTELDASGSLSGRYVRVRSETGSPVVVSGTALPAYHRDVDQFEQVMGYYWVTTAHHYLESLGFGADLRPVNDRQIELRVNQYGGDNSFFRDNKADITLGKGGVDDAEDAEVIVHEYGHAVQDAQVPGFGTNLESGSIGEGFSDYLAVAVTESAAPEGPRLRRRLGLVSYTRPPLPAPPRRHEGLPGRRAGRGPRRRRDLVERAVGRPRPARRHPREPGDHRGPVPLRGRHQLHGGRAGDRRHREGPLRRRRRDHRPSGLPVPRSPHLAPVAGRAGQPTR